MQVPRTSTKMKSALSATHPRLEYYYSLFEAVVMAARLPDPGEGELELLLCCTEMQAQSQVLRAESELSGRTAY